MTSKSGGNRHDEEHKLATASETDTMQKELVAASISKIEKVTDEIFLKCSETLAAGSDYFRLQPGQYGGSNVFFNKEGADCRYNLVDGKTGAMYVAVSPKTALKEVFQNKVALKEVDLDGYYMGNVVIERDIQILQITELLSRTSINLNDVTTTSRAVTQTLARKIHSLGFDGMEYISNVTGEKCLVLWHGDSSGKGMANTRKQTQLSKWDFGSGKEAADILVNELGISVD